MIAATACPADVPQCSGLLDVNATLLVELGVFLLTAYTLWRLVWRPIIGILEKRDRVLATGAEAAAEAERRYNDGLAEVQSLLELARAEARDVLAETYRSANTAAEQVRGTAHTEARKITEAALEEIRRESDAAVASLRLQAHTLAVTAASRLLAVDLDEARFVKVAAEGASE